MKILISTVIAVTGFCAGFALAAGQSDEASKQAMAREIKAIVSYQPLRHAGIELVADNDLWLPGKKYQASNDWLALACNRQACALETASLSVKPEFWQGHYDEKPTFGYRLLFKAKSGNDAAVIAWFKQAPAFAWLKPGPVSSYYSPGRTLRQPASGSVLEALVELSNSESALLVPLLVSKSYVNNLFPKRNVSWPMAILQLREGRKRQLLPGQLGTCSGLFHPRHYLLWAGDLDLDKKPDYLISYVDEEGPVHLYLSSEAKPNQLVGLGGIYHTPPFGGECDGPEGFLNYEE